MSNLMLNDSSVFEATTKLLKREQPILSFLNTHQMTQWQGALDKFDQQFSYPLDAENKFRVSHGSNYNAYFDRMGDSRHALMHTREGDVVAIMSFVKKLIDLEGKQYYAIYVSDLKIDEAYRGRGLMQKFYHYLLTSPQSLWFYAGCPLLYFVGMEGAKGTIMRTFKGFWSRRFIKPLGYLKSYLISPQELLQKLPARVAELKAPIYNLSAAQNRHLSQQYFDCKGVLNFFFDPQAKEASSIAHLNISSDQGQVFLDKLYHVAESTKDSYDYVAFALDERRNSMITAFAERGIVTNTRAVIGGFSLISGLRQHILHLNTDEI